MKQIKYILSVAAALIAFASCNLADPTYGRIDQKDDALSAPDPVEVLSVRSTPGGAVIKIQLPKDKTIKGVIASYERNGQLVEARISRFLDSLVICGFPNDDERKVEVCAFNINETKSSPVEVKVKPLPPTVKTVRPTLLPTFGGVKVHILGNENKDALAVTILRDTDLADTLKPVKDMKWVEVTTLFTGQNDIKLTRRKLPIEKAVYGVCVRDRWNNYSDTVWKTILPIVEVVIPKTARAVTVSDDGITSKTFQCSGFSHAPAEDDNLVAAGSTTALEWLWNGGDNGTDRKVTNSQWPNPLGNAHAGNPGEIFATDKYAPIPGWFTIDLGCVASISRVLVHQRYGYNPFQDSAVREIEFWGSNRIDGDPDPNLEHGFSKDWFCLGKFTTPKPSGYMDDGSVGAVDNEDIVAYNEGADYEFDTEAYPRCNDEIRYVRVVVANTFATWELRATEGAICFGEVTFFGKVVSEVK